MRRVFEKECYLSTTAAEAFGFHERPDAFRVLTPKSQDIVVRSTASTLEPSRDVVSFTNRVMGIPLDFEMVHTVYESPHRFVDEQLHGPFSTWKHEHLFIESGWERRPVTRLVDRIEISHPLLILGGFVVLGQLSSLFKLRHEITRRELAPLMAQRAEGDGQSERIERVALTGATGLIGRRLTEVLVESGVSVTVLVRNVEGARKLFGETVEYARWDFTNLDDGRDEWKRAIAEADGVVHLAGTPLFGKRWTPEFEKEMLESRTLSTRAVVDAIAELDSPPKVLVTASAIGIYGTDPTQIYDECDAPGGDLLARICLDWEAESRNVERAGVRSAQVRIGIVLSPQDGALKSMLLPFRLGLGGVLGKPRPWINWVHLEDVVRIIEMNLFNSELNGPVNAVSPHPVTNAVLARTLAQVLRRPCLLPYPTVLLKAAIGKAAEYASGGPRVRADFVKSRGYRFVHPELEPALRSLLDRPR